MTGRDQRHVALLFHEGEGGGASMAIVRILDLMQERGWRLSAYVDRPGRLSDLLEERGVAVDGRERQVGFSLAWLRHSPGPAAKLKAMPGWFGGLGGWLRRTRPDLVHANGLYSLPDGLLARGLRLPTYLHLHEMLPSGRKGMLARRAIGAAGISVGAVSEACADRFRGPGAPEPYLVLNGVPMPETLPERDPSKPPVVGMIGYVTARKGTDLFVEAARAVRDKRPDVEFRIVGANADRPGFDWGEKVLAEARSLGIEHVVGADGMQQLEEFDVLVMPSRFDPYPLSVLESMASGVPVVGAAVDGIVEQVVEGTGFLARAEDAQDMAAKVLSLVEDPDMRRRMGAAAREHALKTFRLEHQADAQDRAWRGALGK
jgi:glycosyltransferase involved in cell wall biosynthesis